VAQDAPSCAGATTGGRVLRTALQVFISPGLHGDYQVVALAEHVREHVVCRGSPLKEAPLFPQPVIAVEQLPVNGRRGQPGEGRRRDFG
jgi:hypothetical protein